MGKAIGFAALVIFVGLLCAVGAQFLGEAIADSLNNSAELIRGNQQ